MISRSVLFSILWLGAVVVPAARADSVGLFSCFEYGDGALGDTRITEAHGRLNAIGVDYFDRVLCTALDDCPETSIYPLYTSLQSNRSQFIYAHGAPDGMLIGPWETETGAIGGVADAEYLGCVNATPKEQYGVWWVKLGPSAISTCLRSVVLPEANLFLLSCNSASFAQLFWETGPSEGVGEYVGPAYVAAKWAVDSGQVRYAFDFIVKSMTCGCSPRRYMTFEGMAPRDYEASSSCLGLDDAEWDIRGNGQNTLNDRLDCVNTGDDAPYPTVSPRQMGATGRRHFVQLLSGHPQPPIRNGSPDGTASPPASTHDDGRWFLQDSEAGYADGLAVGPWAQTPRIASNDKTLEPPCQLCADVIAYSSSWTMANAAASHFSHQDNGHGQYMEARIVVGGVDPSGVTDALEETIAANRDFNEEHLTNRYPVHPGPVVVVVGDASPVVVHTPTMEDEHNACLTWACRTYFDLVDLNQDGRPEAPIQVIPAQTAQDVYTICDRAEEWNDGDWVEPSGSVAVFMNDLDGEPQSSYLNESLTIAKDYGNVGIPSRGLNLASQYAPGHRCAAGADIINRGIRDLWVMGRRTSYYGWTQFMEYCDLGSLTKKQRVVVFAPSCQTAAIWRGNALAEQLLLADPSGTAAAAVIGNLNYDYWRKHRIAGYVLRDEYLSAAVGTPFSRILYDAVHRLGDLGYSHLARGMVMLGGHAVKRGESAPQGIVEPAAPWQRQGPRLWPTPWDGRGVLYLSNVDGCDAATVEVFNAAGAKVAEWDARADEQKRTERIVATSAAPDRLLASGVYFARISCGGLRTARTLLVVR